MHRLYGGGRLDPSRLEIHSLGVQDRGQFVQRVSDATAAEAFDDVGVVEAEDGGEGAKFWLSVLAKIKNRGVEDVCFTAGERLNGPLEGKQCRG